MIGTAVAERRQAKVASILEHAWRLARTEGFGGLTLRALAREVGMRQPSLYEYFESKNALLDAMFADGNRQLLERLDSIELPKDGRRALKRFMRAFLDFSLEDAARAELLFLRPIRGFEPSPHAYAYAEELVARATALLNAVGVDDPGDVDCFIAMVAGLATTQASNEPGGTRWTRHLERMIDMHLSDARRRGKK